VASICVVCDSEKAEREILSKEVHCVGQTKSKMLCSGHLTPWRYSIPVSTAKCLSLSYQAGAPSQGSPNDGDYDFRFGTTTVIV